MRNDTKNQKPFRPLVYICPPFSGDVEGNTERTRQFCRFALEHGQIPLAPHLMFPQFVNDEDPEERNLALFMDIVLQGKCQELWVLGDVISEGMRSRRRSAADSRYGISMLISRRWMRCERTESNRDRIQGLPLPLPP